MNTNDPIEIATVANGYIVRPFPGRDMPYNAYETCVFQTFEELAGWLSEHFTHRASVIAPDPRPPGNPPERIEDREGAR